MVNASSAAGASPIMIDIMHTTASCSASENAPSLASGLGDEAAHFGLLRLAGAACKWPGLDAR